MSKKRMWAGLVVVGIFVLSGCTTLGKNDALSNQGLRNQVAALESQLKEKDNEINSLKEASVKTGEDLNLNVSNEQIDPKQIQTALKNAGYYQGMVDGKKGKKTRRAVREFQKANNLPVDGRVGKNTWEALKGYLDKKVK